MAPLTIALVVFLCTFGGALAGMYLRTTLPDDHVEDRSKATVTASIGLVATMTALILGLVTASAKSSYDAVDSGVKHTAAQILILDRTLARYGPETRDIRNRFQELVQARVDAIWPESSPQKGSPSVIAKDLTSSEHLVHAIRTLTPANDIQRTLQVRATELAEQVLDARWVVGASAESVVPTAFLVILIFWLAVTFTNFGLFAPRNRTVATALFISALSVSCAIFLVLELGTPFNGVVKVSGEPMRHALSLMNQ